VRWTFYLPESMTYSDFGGTLRPDETVTEPQQVVYYDSDQYATSLETTNRDNLLQASRSMTKSLELAQQGRQREAKLAIQNAQNYSLSDQAFNEDARVQLRNLQVQQAMVALVNRRDSVRPRQGRGLIEPRDGQEAGANFTQDAAERVLNSLGQEETESLQTIADRMYDQQTAAEKFNWPLYVDIALRGRVLRFERGMQVKPDVEMNVSFAATEPPFQRRALDYVWALGVAAVVFLVMASVRRRAAETPAGPVTPVAAPDENSVE
jgi:hypothetical protein